MKLLTAKRLLADGACADQVRKFRQVFPGGAPITLASVEKAQKAGLDWEWTIILLSLSAWVEYDKVCGLALAEYEKVCGLALAESEKVCGLALIAALAETEGE
jgi:hypothetical protein